MVKFNDILRTPNAKGNKEIMFSPEELNNLNNLNNAFKPGKVSDQRKVEMGINLREMGYGQFFTPKGDDNNKSKMFYTDENFTLDEFEKKLYLQSTHSNQPCQHYQSQPHQSNQASPYEPKSKNNFMNNPENNISLNYTLLAKKRVANNKTNPNFNNGSISKTARQPEIMQNELDPKKSK